MSSRVAIVGAGRVGMTLGRLLTLAGYEIGEVVCRTAPVARRAVRFVGAGRPTSLRSLSEIASDVILVCTPDDAIRAVATRVAATRPSFEGVVALHASGALDADELEPLRERGAAVGSMHPLQSFPSPELALGLVAGSVFAIEGDAAAVRVARRLARDLGGRPVGVRRGAKALYHAAAVLASGGVTALLDFSIEAMRRAGLGYEDAVRAVMPLVEGTVANVKRAGTAEALTGPFARGDAGTIARNREALRAVDPLAARAYDLLGERGELLRRRRTGDA